LLEQDKSAQQNPISDWADDLWKTIAHWLIAINASDIDPASTTFRLYVTSVHEGGSLETKPNARKAGISRPFSRLLGSLAKRGNGWLTKQGSNSNIPTRKKTFEISIDFPPI